ncbi:MAG: peptidase M20, partial [Blastomonas fulva]|nr:peptidase M20 [Blastomonas fulva]
MLTRTLVLAAALCAVPFTSVLAQPAMTVDPDRLSETVRTLASDVFEGRAPGTRGEERTLGYLIARFEALGLEPAGTDGGWLQKVPLLHTRLGPPAKLGFASPKGAINPVLAQDIYLSTIRPDDAARIADAPVVFVGYGVKAPERGWDDFKGTDLKGKVAVFLINDPDFAAKPGEPAAGMFGDRTMTYYGRWTYKFEEAARQ